VTAVDLLRAIDKRMNTPGSIGNTTSSSAPRQSLGPDDFRKGRRRTKETPPPIDTADPPDSTGLSKRNADAEEEMRQLIRVRQKQQEEEEEDRLSSPTDSSSTPLVARASPLLLFDFLDEFKKEKPSKTVVDSTMTTTPKVAFMKQSLLLSLT